MILEIRTYAVEDGRLGEFVAALSAALPLLESFGIDVVAAGPSLIADEGQHAFLMRAFPDLETRDLQEGLFYDSAAWREGHQAAVLGPLTGYHTIVLDASRETVAQLRRTQA